MIPIVVTTSPARSYTGIKLAFYWLNLSPPPILSPARNLKGIIDIYITNEKSFCSRLNNQSFRQAGPTFARSIIVIKKAIKEAIKKEILLEKKKPGLFGRI